MEWQVCLALEKSAWVMYLARLVSSMAFKYSATVYPTKSESGLLWIKVSVANKSLNDRIFKFNRIRLIANTYIASAKNVFSNVPFAEEGSMLNIKPGTEIERRILFTYEKNIYPYKFVYDDCSGNTIIDKITIDLPENIH